METIFDHNITKDEMLALYCFDYDKSDYLKESNQYQCYKDIYRLYCMRRDTKTAKKYLDLIPDSDYKTFTLAMRDH